MYYFIAFLAGALAGGWIVAQFLSIGFGMMYKRGEIFVKIKGKWMPNDPPRN